MKVGKINLKKIDKSKLFNAKSGNVYLDIVIIPTPNSEYGDYMIKQSVSKEEREQGVEGAILGNIKNLNNLTKTTMADTATEGTATEEGDDLPF